MAFKVKDDLRAKLEEMADKRDLTFSELMREYLVAGIERDGLKFEA